MVTVHRTVGYGCRDKRRFRSKIADLSRFRVFNAPAGGGIPLGILQRRRCSIKSAMMPCTRQSQRFDDMFVCLYAQYQRSAGGQTADGSGKQYLHSSAIRIQKRPTRSRQSREKDGVDGRDVVLEASASARGGLEAVFLAGSASALPHSICLGLGSAR